MKITFYGGAGMVTGANYLLEEEDFKCVIDCGLHQGDKYAEDLNYEKFSYNPEEVKFAFVTHSHIDHIGRFPKLYKEGFRGKVFATQASAEIMKVALPDNLSHIKKEAEGDGREPIFSHADMDGLLGLVEGVNYGQTLDLTTGVQVVFHDAGHVLGSAIIEIKFNGKTIFFSGDLGNPPTPLLRPTEFVHGADYLVVESAYGDRSHEAREERRGKLARVIKETIQRRGTLMIPSFALERTQELLFELNELYNSGVIPRVPIFIDSPLAIKLTEIYEKFDRYFNKDAKYLIASGDDVFKFPGLSITPSPEDSKRINNVPSPKVIIAGSGMSQGGRILHHERRYLPDTASTILFVGYQVDGSLGRRIQRGDKEVKIFGEPVAVRCRVETISSYSAHADQPALLRWISEAGRGGTLKKVFVVQGEENSAKTLASLVHDNLDIEAVAPKTGDSFEL